MSYQPKPRRRVYGQASQVVDIPDDNIPDDIAEATRHLLQPFRDSVLTSVWNMAQSLLVEAEQLLSQKRAIGPSRPPVPKKLHRKLKESYPGVDWDRDDILLTQAVASGSFGADINEWLVMRLEYHRTEARWLYQTNPHYRGIIRHAVNYIVGENPMVAVEPVDKNADKSLASRVADHWKRKEESARFSFPNLAREFVERALRDGEEGCRRIHDAEAGIVHWRHLQPEWIVEPVDKSSADSQWSYSYGIQTPADDVETIEAFWYQPGGGLGGRGTQAKPIESDDVVWCKLGTDSNQKRGLPHLFTATPMIRRFADWIMDRIILNKVRTAIAVVITNANSPPGATQARTDRLATGSMVYRGSDNSQQTVKTQRIFPGTTIRAAPGEDWKYLNPNTGADDAAADGRAIALAISVCVGYPEFMVSGDASNNNYSSALVAESPGVRTLICQQQFFGEFLCEIPRKTVELEMGLSPEELAQLRFMVSRPDVISRDPLQRAQETETLVLAKIMSRKTAQKRHGLDPEEEDESIELDATEPVGAGGEPLDTPPAPKVGGKPKAGGGGKKTVKK